MKCPFCQQELSYWGMDTWYCANCAQTKFSRGNRELWKELITARKALDEAIEGITYIKDTYLNAYDRIDAQRILDKIESIITKGGKDEKQRII